MDRGNENTTQHLPWWLRKTTKKPQVDRHRDLNPRTPECKSRALPRSHLAWFCFFFFFFPFSLSQIIFNIAVLNNFTDIHTSATNYYFFEAKPLFRCENNFWRFDSLHSTGSKVTKFKRHSRGIQTYNNTKIFIVPVCCTKKNDNTYKEAKDDWDLRIYDLVKNPDGTDI